MQTSPDDPFGQTVEAYRAAGWTGTLPLPHGAKHAPPVGFTGEAAPWPERGNIETWRGQGRHNIALRLPPNVIALDIDEPTAFLDLLTELGPLPSTWRADSGGSRLGHLYYRLPAGVVSRGWGAPCPGVDLLRHGHRYSIVWPSLHPSGTRYRWIAPEAFAATGLTAPAFPAPGDLPELPAAWVAHLSGEARADSTLWDESTLRDSFGDVGQVIESGRHQEALFQHACSMRARQVPESEAAAVIRQRAAKDCRPPWAGPDDPWDAVRHAYKYPEGNLPEGPALGMVGGPPSTDSINESKPPFPIVDWAQAWEAPENEDWILEPLIAAARGIALYSAPKLGKSLLLLEVAVAISQGRPVLGITPPRARTVLYVDHENDLRGDVVRRLRNMGFAPADLAGLRYLNLPVMASLDGAAGGAELLAVAQREGAELVVIDTVSRAISGEENANDTWLAFYRHTGKALKSAGIACVRLDHSGKDETRGQRGASAKSGDVDAVWQLTSTGGEEFLLYCEAQRMGIPEAGRSIAFRRVDEPVLRHERTAAPTRLSQDAKRLRALREALAEADLLIDPTDHVGAPKSGRAIERELAEAGVPFSKGFAASVVKARWAYLKNAFAPLPEYAQKGTGHPRPADLGFEGAPPVPPSASSVPPSASGAPATASSAPHTVGGGTGAPSPTEGSN